MRPKASGKFVLRLPPGLHERLRGMARGLGISLNTLCVRLLIGATEPATAGSEALSALQTSCLELVAAFAGQARIRVLGTVLFGSAARNELRPGSDIDLLLVCDRGVPLARTLYTTWDLLAPGGDRDREVNAHFVHLPRTVEEAGSLWLEAAVEGVIAGDETGQVERFLQELRRAVASGRFVRSVVHGQPFWKRAS
jgi:predicted nucleotidyltransferase